MFERIRKNNDAKRAKIAEAQTAAEDARINTVASRILKAIHPVDGTFSVARVEGSRSNDGSTMKRIGEILLENGLIVIIGETCEGFNTIGTAVDRHIEVIPRGQKLPEYWNPIFPPGAQIEGTKPFKLLDNIPGKEGVAPSVGDAVASLDTRIEAAMYRSTLGE